MNVYKRLKLFFRNPKGTFQALKYAREAKHFWNENKRQLVEELSNLDTLDNLKSLRGVTENYSDRVGFPELSCDIDEIHSFHKDLLAKKL